MNVASVATGEVGVVEGADGGSSDPVVPTPLTVDGQVEMCVDYVFGAGFKNDTEERSAFVDAFRRGGRYGSFNVLRSDFDKARPQEPDYLVLHEVHAALSVLPEADWDVAFRVLRVALLSRQAIELLAQPRG